MPLLTPFRALCAEPSTAGRFIAPPYDVPGDAEARAILAAAPESFLRVTRPEITMAPGTDPHSEPAYSRARELMGEVLAKGLLRREAADCYGVYRLTWRGRSQTGLVGLAPCTQYQAGNVARHELTRPDKENDRTRHIVDLRAQTGPVFLAFRSGTGLEVLLGECTSPPPGLSVDTGDGVLHEAWVIRDRSRVGQVAAVCERVEKLYICDGHHRAAAGTRASLQFPGNAQAQGFLSVAFPHDQLRILPYHRLVLDMGGRDAGTVRLEIERATCPPRNPAAPPEEEVPGEVCVFLAGSWFRRALPAGELHAGDAAARLEASVLQRLVLAPILGIDDPRTSPRIRFVGGIKGPGELARAVSAGEAAIGFAMPAVTMEQLFAVADAGLLMPPKSTWFEPKLRDGVFVNAW